MAGRTHTVVKARYSRGAGPSLRLAKGHVRYAIHRTNDAGRRQYREIWDRDGSLDKTSAYTQLDGATSRDYVYRLMLSPHPERQDAGHRLDLQDWTRGIMARLEREMGHPITWFAVTHEQAEHRHVHVVAVSPQSWRVPHFHAMREAGDANANAQQRQLDQQQCPAGLAERRRAFEHDREPPPAARRPPVPTEIPAWP